MVINKDVFQKFYVEGMPVALIAEKFNCSTNTVRYWRKKFGFEQRLRIRCNDLCGRRFGRWAVLEKVQYHHKVKWRCRCDCGSEAEIAPDSLVLNKSTKCRDCGYVSDRFIDPVPQYYWIKVLHRAKRSEILITVTKEYCRKLYEKQGGRCAITGIQLRFGASVKEFKQGKSTASLDRIDSSKGYIEDNVQWVHKVINSMKSNMSQLDFIQWCQKIVDYKDSSK